MKTPQQIEQWTAVRRELEQQMAQVEAMRLPHNYCFTVSDDEVCDVGMGDCRKLVRLLHRELADFRACIAWAKKQERQ
jgi:hypothetical protein